MHPIRYAGLSLALLPTLSLLSARPAAAQGGYSFVSFDAPGAAATSIRGVNDSGLFAGAFADQNASVYGFIHYGPSVLDLYDPSVPQGTSGYLEINQINNAGTYVGDYGAGTAHGFIGSGLGPVSTSDEPSSSGLSYVEGINNNGVTVGTYLGSDGNDHSYVQNGSTFTSFDVPGYGTSQADGINDAGAIVGEAATDPNTGPTVSYLKLGSALTFLNIPGAVDVFASDINNLGMIVGSYDTVAGGDQIGFIDFGGVITNIVFPSGDPNNPTPDTEVLGLNNAGEIVGQYTDAAGKTHGFYALGTPAPEPSQAAAFGLGVLALSGLMLKARKRQTA